MTPKRSRGIPHLIDANAQPILVAAIYGRVSNDPHKRSRSVAQQIDTGKDACQTKGWTLGGVYKDPGISASRYAKKAREDWPRLVADLNAGRFGVLIVWEPSRASRELGVWAILLDTCRDQGVLIHVISHDHTYDPRKPRDYRTLAEDAVDAAYEADKGSERVRRGLRGNMEAGLSHGRVPYGWRREYDLRSGAYVAQVEVPEKAEIVRECATRIAAGETPYSIAKDLNERGVPSPAGGRWDINGVSRMVLRPANIARRTHYGEDVGPGQWPAIVDEITYYTCVRILSDPSRSTRKDGQVTHLLSGIIRCGVCGGMMRPRVGSRKYPVYQCVGGVDERAFCVAIHLGKIEVIIEALAIGRLSNPDLREALVPVGDDAALAMAELEKLRTRLDEFYDAASAGELTPTGLARIEATMLPQIDAAKKRCELVTRFPLLDQLAGPDAERKWAGVDLVQRREVIRELMTIMVLRVGPGRRLPDLARADLETVRAALVDRLDITWLI